MSWSRIRFRSAGRRRARTAAGCSIPGAGCRLWDWHPAPEDTATWSGACLSGRKEGHGVVQWYEHGRPIDRFEGVFRRGKREGFGRYDWPAGQRYQGTYETDLPNGQGTVTIDGVSFAGAWRRGCLVHGDKLIAIGIPLSTCGRGKRPMSKAPRPAGAGYGDGGLVWRADAHPDRRRPRSRQTKCRAK